MLMIKTPLLAVDAVILYENKLLFIRRGNPPYQGWPAITGGFVEVGESCEAAIEREVMEETGLFIDIKGLVGVYSNPARDSRGHVVSVCYFAIGRGEPKADSDADDIVLAEIDDVPELAFDHNVIVTDAHSFIDEYCL
ncbi:MAG: NUDIX hydrolase [Methanosarcinales archaeon]|nr:NUDIX hydrolase [Methanosarcinales archaeon]